MASPLGVNAGSIGALLGGAETVWMVAEPTEHFFGRDDLLPKIDAALAGNRSCALTALHGLGGIGKSQMARKYAAARRDRYRLAAWIEAETPGAIVNSFLKLARSMGLAERTNAPETVDEALAALAGYAPWLLIFDNAVEVADLREYKDRLRGGHVLITSRNEDWGAIANRVEVSQWTATEGAAFLLERTGQADRDAALRLAKDLDGLPLALEHAAAYINVSHAALAGYLDLWRIRLQRESPSSEYPRSVAATLGLSLDRLEAESPTAYDLLCLFAFFAPDSISAKYVLTTGSEALPERLRSAWTDPESRGEVVAALKRYSLARVRGVGEEIEFGVHCVVQSVMRARLGERQGEWRAVTLAVLRAASRFEEWNNPDAWPAYFALLDHVAAVVEGMEDLSESASWLLNEMGAFLMTRGRLPEAHRMLESSLKAALKNFGRDHPAIAVRRGNLAAILRALGELAAARTQFQLALDVALQNFRPDHPTVAVCRSNLAMILRDLGEHAAARAQIELALDVDLKNFGTDHPNVARRRSNRALILQDLSEHPAARTQIELALDADLKNFGPNHPNVAIRRSNRATILWDLGERQEARVEQRKAYEINRELLGEDHPTTRAFKRLLDQMGG